MNNLCRHHVICVLMLEVLASCMFDIDLTAAIWQSDPRIFKKFIFAQHFIC